jgi:LCP family protein required for cell wall assembly
VKGKTAFLARRAGTFLDSFFRPIRSRLARLGEALGRNEGIRKAGAFLGSIFGAVRGRLARLWQTLRANEWIRRIPLRYILLAGLLTLMLVCVVLYLSVRSYAPVAARGTPTLTPTPFHPATLTPTPFGAFLATPEPRPSVILPRATPTPFMDNPPWAPYAGPIHAVSTAIPTPVPEFDQGDQVMNIALLGVDTRPYGGSFNTDTMIILSLNREKKTAVLISFPRDLYVYIPMYGMWRLNAAFAEGNALGYSGGGFHLFQDTMKYNFGLRIDHYALINFSGFKELINNLGGIDVYAASTLSDARDGYDFYTVPAGMFHMDGETALWYVRSRYTSNDIDRTRRQQEVLVGMVQRLLNLNALGNIPGFFVTLAKYVESDLTLDMLTPYLELASQISPASVRRFNLREPDHVHGWWTPEGSNVLLPDYPAILSYLDSALNQ